MTTLETLDSSIHDSRPGELYEIRYSGQVWRYTNTSTQIVRASQTWVPQAISRDIIESGTPTTKSNCSFKLPENLPVADIFRARPPSELVMMTVWEIDMLHPEAGERVIWKGRITNCMWQTGEIVLTSESVFSSLRRTGLRRRYQVRCPHALYGEQCGVVAVDHREEYVLGSYSGLTLTVPGISGKPDNYFSGGFLTWVNGTHGNVEKLMIRSSGGTSVTVSGLPQGLVAGAELSMYKGCDHRLTSGCAGFGNEHNYGGMWFKPQENPFDGNSLF